MTLNTYDYSLPLLFCTLLLCVLYVYIYINVCMCVCHVCLGHKQVLELHELSMLGSPSTSSCHSYVSDTNAFCLDSSSFGFCCLYYSAKETKPWRIVNPKCYISSVVNMFSVVGILQENKMRKSTRKATTTPSQQLSFLMLALTVFVEHPTLVSVSLELSNLLISITLRFFGAYVMSNMFCAFYPSLIQLV